MVRGIYTGASAMMARVHEMDVTSNNLANVDKTGFKRQKTVFKAFPDMLISRMNDDGMVVLPNGSSDDPAVVGRLGTGVSVNEVFTQFEQGSLQQTQSDFDFSLHGKGFFVVETPQGVRYTRNGAFTRDKEGYLVTQKGDYVLGQQGRIKAQDFNFKVDDRGNIYRNPSLEESPDKLVGKIENRWDEREVYNAFQIVDFENTRELKKQGDSYFAATEFSGEAVDAAQLHGDSGPKVRQGFLEKANVKVVDEMVNMITLNRAYEANQKSVRTHDDMLGKLVNVVLRV